MDDRLVAIAAHITDNLTHEFCSAHILAEQLPVALADFRIQFHLIKRRFREQPLDLSFPDFSCLDDFHAFASLSNICRKSSTIAWMRSNFSLKLTRFAMRRAVASIM